MLETTTYTAVFEDGSIVENLSHEDSYTMFLKAHKSENQCWIRRSDYGYSGLRGGVDG